MHFARIHPLALGVERLLDGVGFDRDRCSGNYRFFCCCCLMALVARAAHGPPWLRAVSMGRDKL